jgi:hypothetical protein
MLGRPRVVVNCRGKLVGRRVEAYWTVRRWRDRTRRLGIRGSPNGGLIVVVSGASLIHREFIVTLAARHQLPVVYPYRVFVTGGGLTKGDAPLRLCGEDDGGDEQEGSSDENDGQCGPHFGP